MEGLQMDNENNSASTTAGNAHVAHDRDSGDNLAGHSAHIDQSKVLSKTVTFVTGDGSGDDKANATNMETVRVASSELFDEWREKHGSLPSTTRIAQDTPPDGLEHTITIEPYVTIV
jgi:hypothetical protein